MTSDELLELETTAMQSIDGNLRGPALKAVARIREQRELLDECEMLISGLECRCDGMNRCARCVTLDKLRGQEKDR